MDSASVGFISTHLTGPWPDGRDLLQREVDTYLTDAAGDTILQLPTRCSPWTVNDVTIHLAESLRRFNSMIERARHGDFTPPFPPEEIDQQNLRAVELFSGDPKTALRDEARELLRATTDLDEPVPHQMGVMPAGLQVLFGLVDITLHHDDVLSTTGHRYPIPDDVAHALQPAAVALFGVAPDEQDVAGAILVGSGRPPI